MIPIMFSRHDGGMLQDRPQPADICLGTGIRRPGISSLRQTVSMAMASAVVWNVMTSLSSFFLISSTPSSRCRAAPVLLNDQPVSPSVRFHRHLFTLADSIFPHVLFCMVFAYQDLDWSAAPELYDKHYGLFFILLGLFSAWLTDCLLYTSRCV